MKIFFDSKYYDHSPILELLSVCLVSEDGRELYLENKDVVSTYSVEWLNKHGNLIDGCAVTKDKIKQAVTEFVGDNPEFWSYCGAYGWVALCGLFGDRHPCRLFVDQQEGRLPMYMEGGYKDLRQIMDDLGLTKYNLPDVPPRVGSPHNAISSARWIRDAYASVMHVMTLPEEDRETIRKSGNTLVK